MSARKVIKVLFRVFIIFCVLIAVIAIAPRLIFDEATLRWLFAVSGSPLRIGSRILPIVVGGRTYHVPANYLDSPLEHPLGQEEGGMLLTALLPTLEAQTRENRDEFMKVRGWGRRVLILINVTILEKNKSLDIDLMSAWIFPGKTELSSDEIYGLRHLMHVSRVRKYGYEAYEEYVDGQRQSVIVCDIEGAAPAPGCSHTFFYDNLSLKVSYHRRNLPHWKAIEESIVALLQHFTEAPDR